jgi:hypothetical protein
MKDRPASIGRRHGVYFGGNEVIRSMTAPDPTWQWLAKQTFQETDARRYTAPRL